MGRVVALHTALIISNFPLEGPAGVGYNSFSMTDTTRESTREHDVPAEERRIRELLSKARWRKARDEAKPLAKPDRARYLPLLIEANAGLVREMLTKGQNSEAPQISYPDWKDELRRNFEAWLSAVEEIPNFEDKTEKEPNLYSFYEQLAILNAESRKSNRRSAEAFSQWGGILERFEADLQLFRDRIDQTPDSNSQNASLSRKHCLAFIELLSSAMPFGSIIDSV